MDNGEGPTLSFLVFPVHNFLVSLVHPAFTGKQRMQLTAIKCYIIFYLVSCGNIINHMQLLEDCSQ
jgi:hypothetical protein